MSDLKPSEKRGGYSGSAAKGPVKAPKSKGANVTPTANSGGDGKAK